jgi:hypothetical protein
MASEGCTFKNFIIWPIFGYLLNFNMKRVFKILK